jgi:hypothetical protein
MVGNCVENMMYDLRNSKWRCHTLDKYVFFVTDMIGLPCQVTEHGTWFEITSLVTDFTSFRK